MFFFEKAPYNTLIVKHPRKYILWFLNSKGMQQILAERVTVTNASDVPRNHVSDKNINTGKITLSILA
jgi:hypothetical protein